LDISPVITHCYGAEDFEQGFAVMREGEWRKLVLDSDADMPGK